MDNPSNPVFFNTFDPFDTPTPPKPTPTPVNSQPSNVHNIPPVNNNSNNPYNNFFPSNPLDSPAINPYPLPTREHSFTSQSPTPLTASTPPPSNPSYSSLSNSYINPPPTSTPASVPRPISPVSSPSLSSLSMSSQGAYPQLHQAPSPIPHQLHQPMQAPSPVPQQQSPSPVSHAASPIPQLHQQPYQSRTSSHDLFQDNYSQPKPQPPPTQQAAPTQTPPPQYTPPAAAAPSHPLGGEQNQKLLEQINGNLSAVMTRLDGIENRISALEIATKEVLNNQRTISTQQRKLQDSVDTKPVPIPMQMPQQHLPQYEDPRKPQPQAQPPAPVHHQPPMYTPTSVIMPPPTHSHPHMPSLVPVTHISDRGAPVSHYSNASRPTPVASYDADLELAKKLQAEFDSASSSSSTSSSSSSSSSLYPSTSNAPSSSSYSKPAQPAAAKSGQQECPICQTRVAIADLEAHVEQHFEDEEAKRLAKPGEKPMNKTEAKAGFFARIFSKEEDKKPANTEAPAEKQAQALPVTQVPYAHTMTPAAFNQRYYNMAAAQNRAMYNPAYYGYPMQVPPQAMPPQGGQGGQRGQNPQQQFLYYPHLDQAPQ